MRAELQDSLKKAFPNLFRQMGIGYGHSWLQKLIQRVFDTSVERRQFYWDLQRKFRILPPLWNMRGPIELFGIECGDGWYDLIWELCEKLEDEILKLPRKHRKYVYATQVKEKFGTIRFYMSSSTDEMEDMIEEAHDRSERTCEVCGAPGKLYTGFWWYTACDKHKNR